MKHFSGDGYPLAWRTFTDWTDALAWRSATLTFAKLKVGSWSLGINRNIGCQQGLDRGKLRFADSPSTTAMHRAYICCYHDASAFTSQCCESHFGAAKAFRLLRRWLS